MLGADRFVYCQLSGNPFNARLNATLPSRAPGSTLIVAVRAR
jgi:hypothetical protein